MYDNDINMNLKLKKSEEIVEVQQENTSDNIQLALVSISEHVGKNEVIN